MIQSLLRTYKSIKPISNFYFWKKWYFQIYLDCLSWGINYILGHNFWLIFSNVLKFVDMKGFPRPHLLLKFGPKTWKSLVTCTCPQKLYSPKRTFIGCLGVKGLKKFNYMFQIYVRALNMRTMILTIRIQSEISKCITFICIPPRCNNLYLSDLHKFSKIERAN